MSQTQAFPGSPRPLATTTALDVSIVDGTGAQITTFGGGTQYTEGDVDSSITGTAAMWEDTGNVVRTVSAATPLPVNIISGAGSGGTAITDDSAFTVGSTNVTPAGGVYKATRDAVDDGDVGAVAMTAKRGQYATIETPDGDSAMDDTLNVVKTMIVDGAGAQITTFGGGTQYTEGDTDASITGTAMLMEGAANTLLPVPGTTADGLLVNLGANNDVTVASLPLPSGASTAANQTTIIGHVDGIEGLLTTIDADTSVLSAIDYATGADVASLGVVGSGTEATAQRVTIATDSSGVLSVDDNGGSLTVDGTVSVTGSVTVADGGSSISVDDNGGSLTVDGTVAVTNSALSTVGSGTEATAMRVTIATDSTGVLSIDDNGSSITVDGSVGISAGSNTIGSVKITDGVTTASVSELGAADALNVAILDGTGTQITSFGGGTQYTEDVTAAADPVGTAPILVRADSPSAITSANGDNVAQRGTNYGAGFVQVVTSSGAFVDTFGGSGGTASIDDSNFVTGTTNVTPAGAIYRVVRDAVDDQDVGALAMTATRALYATIETPNGDSAMDDTLNVVKTLIVDGAGAQITSFGGGTQYADGSARGTATGTLCMVDDGTNIQSMSGDSSGRPNVNIIGTVTVDTELPSIAALADATANPTTTSVGSHGLVYNGSTWDMARSGVTTPTSTVTGMQNTVPWAKYDTTPTARTNGQSGPLQADTNGALQTNLYTKIRGEDETNDLLGVQIKPLASTTYAPTRYAANAITASIKASTGNIFSCYITNLHATSGTTQYLQLFNTTSALVSGTTVPQYSFAVAYGGTTVVGNDFFTNAGLNFSTGIYFGVSTTGNLYTAGTSSFVGINYI